MQQPSPTLWLPKHAEAQQFLRIMDGTSYLKYRSMWHDITSQAGTKVKTVNWIDPDVWIPERLTGDSRALAFRLWRESGKLINPRWSYEIWRFIQSYMFSTIQGDAFALTSRGKQFTNSEETITKEIDEREGLLFLLSEIANRGPGARRDFIGNYTRFIQLSTTWKDSSIASSFSVRLNNLADRNLIAKTRNSFQITDAGLSYLQRVSGSDIRLAPTVELVVNQKNAAARQQLTEFLQTMNPYKFEYLIKRLLEDMGYDDVKVTSPANDKGVDVVADIELGISKVREVIQVKRHQGNIGRPILDQLRGSLHYFDAVRGTIITTAGFTKGANDAAFAKGASPITLIDGITLVNLLIENDIGVRRREIRVLEFDPENLNEFETDEDSALSASGQLESV